MNRCAIVLMSFLVAQVATAGQQYVDESGFAASGYDVVAFFGLQQHSVGEAQPEAVPGKKTIVAEYNGAKWAFASEENKVAFLADPERYLPAYDGHCAYGVAKGGKVPGNPNLWRIVDDTLYFNITPNVVSFWEEDISGFIVTAEENWTGGVETEPASERSWKAINANDATYSKVAPVE
ncbi:MAG: YHS domain-containing (seleno)protein [Candidatus Competibacterales bacterium]